MTKTEPLLLVLAVLILLWFIGLRLNKIKLPANNNKQVGQRGIEILPFLHVLGLQDYQCSELKAIAEHGDEPALRKFITYYRPGFVELDQYIAILHNRYLKNLSKSLAEASEIEKIAAANRTLINDSPEPYDFNLLSKAELRLLYEFSGEKNRILNSQLVQNFGDTHFIENFESYRQLLRERIYTLYIPKKNSRRPLLDLLANSGVVLKGRRIELKDRLGILSLEQLNDMAKELKINKVFQSHKNAVEILSQVPGSAILLAMLYSIDDLFYLDPAAIDVDSVERGLNLWFSYAKLISWAVKQTTPNIAMSQGL